MWVRVLGGAAGGGFPQWNCNCTGCRRARANDPMARPRTQASVALSADGRRWVLLNASPDITQQIAQSPGLQPDPAGDVRASPIAAVVLSGGDVDCIAGLLSLRERQRFALYAEPYIQHVIADNPIFRVLNPDMVVCRDLARGAAAELDDAHGVPLGLSVEAFAVRGKVPLYQEMSDDIADLVSDETTIGLCLSNPAGRRLVYIPGCAAVTPSLRARLRPADILLFDGTIWNDGEMIAAGAGPKTGARMGHMSIDGPGGSIAAFAGVDVARKVFIHINNTNPILCDDSPEAALVRSAGWDIAYDGMEFRL
jgi:pyrroloquinoline quinone biosynthesis protein B